MPLNKTLLKKSQDSFYVVGIGASAGGLEAITELFENMPDNTGFSFVVVQHISPDHKSLMAELLTRHTVMHTIEAADGMQVKPNCIYVIPSGKLLTIEGGKLKVQSKVKSKDPNHAIDIFFTSLAKDCGDRAIGIVLSGTGTDGTVGIESIKKSGGAVVVQDPVTAAFDGMPNSAMGTNVADLIVPPETMGEEIIEFLNESPAVKSFHAENRQSEYLLKELLIRIRQATGMDFSYYKRPTLLRRIAKRMAELSMKSIKEYIEHTDKYADELHTISKEFLINVSSFFRDKDAFDIIRNTVMPAIMKEKGREDTVKIWSIACSTGEEVYSLAILFREYLEKHKMSDFQVKFFATDIDKEALEAASRGIYPKTILQSVQGDRIAKYFVPEGNAYRISPEIRKMVVFSYHDIIKDPPFSRMDLLICRNMLIYIHPEQQKEILKKLHFAMNIGGYLFLGPSENIGIMKSATVEIDKKWKIYRCIAKMRLLDSDQLFTSSQHRSVVTLPQPKIRNGLQHIAEVFNETLIEDQKIAGIFITKEFEVKHATGNYKSYLDFPQNGFNFNLMKLAKGDLAIALSVAVRKAIKDNERVTVKEVRVKEGVKERLVNVTVKPYLTQKEYVQPFLFVVLSEEEYDENQQPMVHEIEDLSEEHRVQELEAELIRTRANLQAVIEEVETSNEELQSANEEMVTTNEELQSTNEELQSLNEELHTVSAEHQQKIKELTELNDDLNNYFRNSEIGQILIDRKLVIRKFTPAVRKMVNLIDTDVNRSIVDITTSIKDLDLISAIRDVITKEKVVEKEITLNNSTTYFMRITPYVRQDNSVDGVVVNFIDISEVKKLNNMLEVVFKNSSNGIIVTKAMRNKLNDIVDFEYVLVNPEAERVMGIQSATITGKFLKKDFPELGNEYFEKYKAVVESGRVLKFDYFNSQINAWFELSAVKLQDGVLTTFTDVTEKRLAANLVAENYELLKTRTGELTTSNTMLERSNMDLLQFASVASHDLKEPLRKIETFSNLLFEKMKDKAGADEVSYLQKIMKSSMRMQKLIEDVLTVAKLSNGQTANERIDLEKTVGAIKDDLEVSLRERNVEIHVGDLPLVKATEGQMRQLFQNLTTNAIKFNDNEKPMITISHKPVTRKVATELKIDPDKYVVISVKDNGIGFDEKYREKIFGIFQRLNGSDYDGTGIGLAICKKIVDNHKGFLMANSKPNEGAEFLVVLPRA